VGGLALLTGAVLLIVAPWVGDLAVRHDSLASRTTVRLSWWGAAVRGGKPAPHLAIYLLGIRVRKRRLGAPVKRRRKAKGRARWGRLARQARGHRVALTRLALMCLEAGHDLFWQAREVKVAVQAPTGLGFIDEGLAKLCGRRTLGRLVVECSAEGERRLVATYRIGLLRAAVIGLRVLVEGRAPALASSLKRAQKETEGGASGESRGRGDTGEGD